MKWKPISTAPKDAHYQLDGHSYATAILAYPVQGVVSRVRWWQTEKGGGGSNFIDDGGNAAYPTHWQPLPAPPV